MESLEDSVHPVTRTLTASPLASLYEVALAPKLSDTSPGLRPDRWRRSQYILCF